MHEKQIACIKKYFDVFQAYLNGSTIQATPKGTNCWNDIRCPSFDSADDLEYRVKPKQAYQIAYLYNGRDFITTSNKYESLEAFREDKAYRHYKNVPAILLIHPDLPL